MTYDRHGLARENAKDWALSAGFHALLLVSVGWGLLHSPLPAPVNPLKDLSVSWAAMPEPQSLPATPPVPTPPATSPSVVRAKHAPAPAMPPQTRQPSLATAPDVVAPAASVSAPVSSNATIQAEAHQPPNTSQAADAGPAVTKASEQPRWHGQLAAMLLKYKQYPRVAQRMRQEGVVTVEAHFSAQGEVLNCVVANSSGFKALDEAAVQLVRQAADMARAHYQPERVTELRIPIVYQLKDS